LNIALREAAVFAPPLLYLMLVNQKFLRPVPRLWGLALTAYVGIVLTLLTSLNPYF
jgi:hypothetical protein